jgi:hypothetical protein
MYILYPSQHAFNAEIIRPFVCTIPDLILKLYRFFCYKCYFSYSWYNGSLLHFSPHFLENYFAEVKIKKLKTITNHFLRERIDLK